MLFGHVSMPAWGAECSAVLAVVWACECASDAMCLHRVLIAFMCFDPKLLIGQALVALVGLSSQVALAAPLWAT